MNIIDLADLMGISVDELKRRLDQDDVICLDLREKKERTHKEEGSIIFV